MLSVGVYPLYIYNSNIGPTIVISYMDFWNLPHAVHGQVAASCLSSPSGTSTDISSCESWSLYVQVYSTSEVRVMIPLQ